MLAVFGLAPDLNNVSTKAAHQSTVGSLITEQEKKKKEREQTEAKVSRWESGLVSGTSVSVNVRGETSAQPGRSVPARCERQHLLPAQRHFSRPLRLFPLPAVTLPGPPCLSATLS